MLARQWLQFTPRVGPVARESEREREAAVMMINIGRKVDRCVLAGEERKQERSSSVSQSPSLCAISDVKPGLQLFAQFSVDKVKLF